MRAHWRIAAAAGLMAALLVGNAAMQDESAMQDAQLPEETAWSSGGSGMMSFGRIDGPVTVAYDPRLEGRPARLQILVESCAEEGVNADIEPADDTAGDVANASAALQAGLARMTAKCRLDPGLAPRIAVGFEEALAIEIDNFNAAVSDVDEATANALDAIYTK